MAPCPALCLRLQYSTVLQLRSLAGETAPSIATIYSGGREVPLTVSFIPRAQRPAGFQRQRESETAAAASLAARGGGTQQHCNDLPGHQFQRVDEGPVTLFGEPSESGSIRIWSGAVSGARL